MINTNFSRSNYYFRSQQNKEQVSKENTPEKDDDKCSYTVIDGEYVATACLDSWSIEA